MKIKPGATREELIAAGMCVACQVHRSVGDSVWCYHCIRKMRGADVKAFHGMKSEIDRMLYGRVVHSNAVPESVRSDVAAAYKEALANDG